MERVHVGDRLRVVDEQAESAALGLDSIGGPADALQVLLDDAARARHQRVEDPRPHRHRRALQRLRNAPHAAEEAAAPERAFEAMAERAAGGRLLRVVPRPGSIGHGAGTSKRWSSSTGPPPATVASTVTRPRWTVTGRRGSFMRALSSR